MVLGKVWLYSAWSWRLPGAISTSTVPWEGAGNCWVPHAQPSHGEFTFPAAATQNQRALTCPSDHPGCWKRSGAKSWIHPSLDTLGCQRERRAESGSHEDTVVSKHTESCSSFSGSHPYPGPQQQLGLPQLGQILLPQSPWALFFRIFVTQGSAAPTQLLRNIQDLRTLCQRLP